MTADSGENVADALCHIINRPFKADLASLLVAWGVPRSAFLRSLCPFAVERLYNPVHLLRDSELLDVHLFRALAQQ